MLTNALSAKAVAHLKDGKHRDGQGLQFEVKGGSRRWTFSYMFEGRQRELAIGKYPAMSLARERRLLETSTDCSWVHAQAPDIGRYPRRYPGPVGYPSDWLSTR